MKFKKYILILLTILVLSSSTLGQFGDKENGMEVPVEIQEDEKPQNQEDEPVEMAPQENNRIEAQEEEEIEKQQEDEQVPLIQGNNVNELLPNVLNRQYDLHPMVSIFLPLDLRISPRNSEEDYYIRVGRHMATRMERNSDFDVNIMVDERELIIFLNNPDLEIIRNSNTIVYEVESIRGFLATRLIRMFL